MGVLILCYENAALNYVVTLSKHWKHSFSNQSQVISTTLAFFTRGLPPLTFSAAGRVPAAYWGKNNGEEAMEVFKGYLVSGRAVRSIGVRVTDE